MIELLSRWDNLYNGDKAAALDLLDRHSDHGDLLAMEVENVLAFAKMFENEHPMILELREACELWLREAGIATDLTPY